MTSYLRKSVCFVYKILHFDESLTKTVVFYLILGDLLKSTLDGRQHIDKLYENQVLNHIKLSLTKKKQALQGDSNSRVWLQYIEMIDILRSNIRAERTGSYIFW